MATITGTLKNAAGIPLVDRLLTFQSDEPVVHASGSDTIIPDVVNVTSGAAGALSFVLPQGTYTGNVKATTGQNVPFAFVVPAGATATFNDCLVDDE